MKIYTLRIEQAESVLSSLARPSVSRACRSAAFEAFVSELVRALEACSAEPVCIETHRFADLEKAKATLLRPDSKYLCFDSQSTLGIPFGVSRRFDFLTGMQLGVTSRPGCDELQEQIARLKREHGTRFGIIEDDIFTGGTLREMIALFARLGITITSVVSGISSTHRIGSVPVAASVFYEPSQLLELTDPRDYLFGACHGGLVVSCQGQKLRVPYDAAFVDVTVRSSLAAQKVDTFTRMTRAANYRLHQKLDSLSYPAALWYTSDVLRRAGFSDHSSLAEMLRPPVRPILRQPAVQLV